MNKKCVNYLQVSMYYDIWSDLDEPREKQSQDPEFCKTELSSL